MSAEGYVYLGIALIVLGVIVYGLMQILIRFLCR